MIKNKWLLLVLLPLGIACQKQPEKTEMSLGKEIIPQPVSHSVGRGSFTIPGKVTIIAKADEEVNTAGMLKEFLSKRNIESTISEQGNGHILLALARDTSAQPESYQLNVAETGVTIKANSGAGLFYGVQSLIQLIPDGSAQVAAVTISDYPRYSWRGLHLDVGRHMFPVEFIKKYIDLMSHYKFNTFHWHLTEDQGWRIEIKKYPKLQETAAFRKETLVGHGRSPKEYDGKRYGGYYTQEEVKEIVAYAAERYITVVPEIEMPGHSQAALTAYPYLGCTGGPYEVATRWGIFPEVYCAGKESTFEFLQDVMDEVIPLFPSRYVHIGGDECPKDRWKECPQCQQRMQSEHLKDEHELQSYFIRRMEKYLNSKGKGIIGWDEILEGGLAPNAAVMSWRGEEGGIAAAKAGHYVVMSPGFAVYFDHYQGPPDKEPLAIGGMTPLKEVYHYEPTPDTLTAEERKFVLGAQANVWTEYMKTSDHVEYMVYPRALALSEVLWSPSEKHNWENFQDRLNRNFTLLKLWHVNFREPQPADSLLITE